MSAARFPVRYAHANILMGDAGHAVALYRLSLVSYRFLPAAGKWELQRRLERLASGIAADFSLWRVNRAYPAGDYRQEFQAPARNELAAAAAWDELLAAHEQRLGELEAHRPEVYLAVSLAGERRPAGLGAGLIRATDRMSGRVRARVSFGRAAAIPAARIVELAEAERRTWHRLSGLVRARRASTLELQWLLRRAAVRGVSEPALDAHWRPQAMRISGTDGQSAYQPLEQVIWRCANAAISESQRTLRIDGEHDTSYQALLSVGALPDAPLFPGAAAEILFAPLEDCGFPVDAVLHARWVTNRQALGEVRKRIADVENAYSEQAAGSAHGPGILAGQDRVLAREYEAQLQSGSRPAMLYASISLAVGAGDEAELERRVMALRERYGDLLLHRPAGLQQALWMDHLPRPDGGAISDYVQQVSAEQFGAMVPVATHTVGSPAGAYLGYTPSGVRRPVRYDVTAPSREARASTVLLAGTLGSGKTVAAQLIAYAAALAGSQVIDIDPKPDHGFHAAAGLQGQVELVELSGEAGQQGRLDPLSIGIEDMREELACSYLVELLRDPPAAWENAIGRAVSEVARAGGRSSLQVIEALKARQSDPARQAGEALEVLSDLGLARLGFAPPNATGTHAAALTPPVLSIRTPGLSLPDPAAARETYTRAERISAATLGLLAAYVLRLISTDRAVHKVVLLDEAHSFLATRQGRAVVERLVRMGRACNTTVLLATQLLEDLGSLIELIGTWLIFGQEADSQARRALELLGLDGHDEQLVAQLRDYQKGRCLMRDLAGRVGELQVDPVDPGLLAAFNTTPGSSQ